MFVFQFCYLWEQVSFSDLSPALKINIALDWKSIENFSVQYIRGD